jgi:putative transposase
MVSEVWYRIRPDAQATAGGRLGDTWYLDELFVSIQGQRQYLWRAVDQDGDVIDILVQPRRDQRAAERFFRKLSERSGKGTPPTGHRQAEDL